MRLIAILIGGGLFAAVVAEGFYIARTQKQLTRLSARIEELQAQADSEPSPSSSQSPSSDFEGHEPSGRMPPPEFLPALEALERAARETRGAAAPSSDDTLPLPPLLSSPEAREQLRGFIQAQMAQVRQNEHEQRMQQWSDREAEQRNEIAQKLGLTGSTAERFNQILADAQEKRRAVVDRVRTDGVPFGQMRGEMQSAWQESNNQLKSLLGDERFKQYQEMQRSQRGGGGWGDGGGQGRRGGPGGPGATPPGTP